MEPDSKTRAAETGTAGTRHPWRYQNGTIKGAAVKGLGFRWSKAPVLGSAQVNEVVPASCLLSVFELRASYKNSARPYYTRLPYLLKFRKKDHARSSVVVRALSF